MLDHFYRVYRFGLLFLIIWFVGCAAGDQPLDVMPTDEPELMGTDSDGFPYQNPDLSIEVRVDDLLGRLTLEEKIGQMTLVENGSISPQDVTRYHIGAVLSGGGSGPSNDNSAAAWRDMVVEYQEAALETTHQIPLLYGVDAIHGHNNVTDATIFPHNIGLGAARNAELVQQIGRATALETLATSIHWNYAPVLSVPQDIRWGRTYEGYGENTELVTELSTAFLLGLQGVDGTSNLADPATMIGTPKHFVGDGGTAWGSSTQGLYMIDQGVTEVDEATLRAIHLPPYPSVIEAGAFSIMTSYSSWGGLKMHAQQYLMTDVLRGELGFEGFIVSDWQAIDQIDADFYTAVVTAINAGIDMNMVPYDYKRFIDVMEEAVDKGDISEARIDEAVRRILEAKFVLGLFENPFGSEDFLKTVGSDEHRSLARQAVRESLVLLQNRNGVLPMSDQTERVFVAGTGAHNLGLQSGGWTIEWQGFLGNGSTTGVTILQGIQDAVSVETEVIYDSFGTFSDEVKEDGTPLRAEVGIVVVGEQPYAEGHGDSNRLTIDRDLIARVSERVDKVVVIILSGRPLIISEELSLADAWVAAWLPGSEGNGVADVLFGEHPFSGKLSYTWPRTMDQLPFDFSDLPTEGCDAPLFPYGYGLTVEQVEPVIVPICEN